MPTTLHAPPAAALPLDPPRKRWTRAECAELERAGLLGQERLELVDGELIDKMGKNRPHVITLVWMMKWLNQIFGPEFVNPETPIDVSPEENPTNEPEPDLVVFRRPSNLFVLGNPRPEDLCLVVEVADSTLHFDLTKKAALYARAGITDYWVLDVAGRRLFVHRNPTDGHYSSVTEYAENESVAPLAAPDSFFTVTSAFPPSQS